MLPHLVGHRARPSLARRMALVLGLTGGTRRRSPCRTNVGRLAVARHPGIPRLATMQHSDTNGYAQINNILIDSAPPHSDPCEAVHLIISSQVRLCKAQRSWSLEGIQSSVMRYPSPSICRTNVRTGHTDPSMQHSPSLTQTNSEFQRCFSKQRADSQRDDVSDRQGITNVFPEATRKDIGG